MATHSIRKHLKSIAHTFKSTKDDEKGLLVIDNLLKEISYPIINVSDNLNYK